jgi:16S rRNA (cytidine1402-2'-O)-methyltransferase
MPLPGASSVTAALSVSGLVGGNHSSAFVFAGFLPSKAGERERAVQALAQEPRAVVILEAPHRVEALARALAPLLERPLTVARELTKQFEEIATMPAQTLAAWLQAAATRTKGEFVLVLHPVAEVPPVQDSNRLLQSLMAELPLKTAVKLASEISGLGKNELYDAALKLKVPAE